MRLAIFDLDHTLLSGDSDVLWCAFLIEKGLKPPGFREQSDQIASRYRAGTVIPTDYCAFYAATLAGFDTATLRPLREQFLREWVEPRIPDDARELLSKCRAVGDLLVLTTATNRAISELTAGSLGVDHFICTELEMSNGRYTGRTAGILNMRSGKIDRLRAWLDELGRPQRLLREASFYSDSINDVALLSAVQHPVVVDPDPRLEATARQKGWTVLRLSRPN